MKITIKSFWPAIIALGGATILFCLPGDEFPEKSWFEKIFLDKWVHVGLFAVLVLLWSLPTLHRRSISARLHRVLIWIALAFFFYGVIIEFVQGNFIPHRTFGVDDMVADAIGCALASSLQNANPKTTTNGTRIQR
jgi:hypothetical protein